MREPLAPASKLRISATLYPYAGILYSLILNNTSSIYTHSHSHSHTHAHTHTHTHTHVNPQQYILRTSIHMYMHIHVCTHVYMCIHTRTRCSSVRWLRLVGSLNFYVSFAKELYKRNNILQKRPIIVRTY